MRNRYHHLSCACRGQTLSRQLLGADATISLCVETKSCRLSDLPKVAGLAHGPGLGSVYSIRPCLPGPAQGCSKPRLVNNLLSALEYLRHPPSFNACSPWPSRTI